MNRTHLKEAFSKTRIEVKCKTELLEIGDNKITVRSETGTYDIPAETIVLAVGVKAQNALQQDIEGRIPEVYAIGDCTASRNMMEAIHKAYDVALII